MDPSVKDVVSQMPERELPACVVTAAYLIISLLPAHQDLTVSLYLLKDVQIRWSKLGVLEEARSSGVGVAAFASLNGCANVHPPSTSPALGSREDA